MWRGLPNLLSLALVVLIAAVFLGPFGDLDYSWQILTGKQIIESGQLRVVDQLSYTIAGQQLPDFEWLWEVTLYGVWQSSGYVGLKILKLLCAFVPLAIVAYQLRQRGVGWAGILLAMLIAVAVLAPNWNLRPLICTTIGLLVVSGWLHDHCAGRKALSWWLPIVVLIWSNCHPGVITGQALLLGAIAWEWLNTFLRLNTPLDRSALKRLTLIGGLGFLATFISPDPFERLLYPFRTRLDDPIWRVFVEMQPAYQFILRPPYMMAITYLVAFMVAVTTVVRFRSYRLWEIALLVGAGGLANMAVRSSQEWLLLMLAVGLPHVKALRETGMTRITMLANALNKWRELANSPALQWQWHWPAATTLALVAFCADPSIAENVMAINVRDNPVAAVHWIATNDIRGNFFGPADYGSYLVWHRGDRAKSYVDTRGFFFPPQLLADAQLLPALGEGWQERLDRVVSAGTDYFLLETTGSRAMMWQALEPHVEPLYRDGQAVLLTARQVRDGQLKYVAANSIASGTVTQKGTVAPDVR